MTHPKISIIWLNHNSIKILPLVLQSLESIASIDYPNDRFELIVVDNGSTDGGFEKIKEFLEKRSSLRKKIIRLGKNLGFTGGNNVGFEARDRESKYVLLLNNDAVLLQHGLKTLVEYAESFERLGGLQGVILQYGTRLIDSAGDYADELLRTYLLGSGNAYPWILRRPIYITYADGSAALYRVESVLKCVGEKLFIDEFFAYGDDNILGLMLWNCGFPLVSVPEVVAYHARSSTFKRKGGLGAYLSDRNRVALAFISNSRYRHVMLLHALRSTATSFLGSGPEVSKMLIRAFVDGVRLGRLLRSRGIFIDLYKAPITRVEPENLIHYFTSRHMVTRYREEWAIKNLERLVVEH
jgi:GT2 family glycosyltransferase